MIRLLVSLMLLGGLVWFLEEERRAGRFLQVDEVFEDFLIANVRGRFVPEPTAEAGVVLVEMRESEAGEYAAWPPEPIDWRMVLEAVREWEPEVLVIPEGLNWGSPPPQFVGAVGRVLASFPSVVLGVGGAFQAEPPTSTPFLGGLEKQFPRFERITGATETFRPPYLKSLVSAPDETIRVGAELGLLMPLVDGAFPYSALIQHDAETLEWLPSLLAQSLSRVARSPYAGQRLRLGAGAGAHLEGGVFVPLTAAGGIEFPTQPPPNLKVVNALDLMTGKLAETLDADTLEAAKQARVVIVGMSRAQGEELHGLAKALATVLALPKVNQVPLTAQYGIWAVATITALGLVRQGRRRTLLKTVGLVFIAFVLSYLVFESTMLWCPPTIPVALLIGGGVLASAFGKRSPTPAPDAPSKALVES
jgi:hypothetical protein